MAWLSVKFGGSPELLSMKRRAWAYIHPMRWVVIPASYPKVQAVREFIMLKSTEVINILKGMGKINCYVSCVIN